MNRERSTDELAEDLQALTRAIEDLTRKFDQLGTIFLPREVYEAYHAALRAEVGRIDGKLVWATRAAVTGLLFPVLTTVIVALVLLLGAPS